MVPWWRDSNSSKIIVDHEMTAFVSGIIHCKEVCRRHVIYPETEFLRRGHAEEFPKSY